MMKYTEYSALIQHFSIQNTRKTSKLLQFITYLLLTSMTSIKHYKEIRQAKHPFCKMLLNTCTQCA